MQKLLQGVHHFQANVFSKNFDLFNRLTAGQSPQALFITCSDSRMVPDLITQADPGDLFVLRNAGNIIPSYGNGSGAEAAVIEYAIKALKVKDVIICGHSRCGAMRGCLHPEDVTALPQMRDWLRHADAAKEVVTTMYGHLTGDAQWMVMVEENVLAQIENLRTHPVVAAGLAAGEVKLHAWVYKMETGQVFNYDTESGQFVPLSRGDGTPHVVSPVRRYGSPASEPALT